MQCYLRKDEPKRGADGLADEMGNDDIFLGGVKVTPDFDSVGSQDQWYTLAGGNGKVQLGISYQPTYVCTVSCPCNHAYLIIVQGQSLTIEDFELTTVIGKGSFGKVC